MRGSWGNGVSAGCRGGAKKVFLGGMCMPWPARSLPAWVQQSQLATGAGNQGWEEPSPLVVSWRDYSSDALRAQGSSRGAGEHPWAWGRRPWLLVVLPTADWDQGCCGAPGKAPLGTIKEQQQILPSLAAPPKGHSSCSPELPHSCSPELVGYRSQGTLAK